jgi:hypothetical protein
MTKGILPERDILVVGDRDAALAEVCKVEEGAADALFLCTPRPAAISMFEGMLPTVRDGGCIDLVGGFDDGESDRIAAWPRTERGAPFQHMRLPAARG